MDLRNLRNMIAVLETGSLGKAAERLHISQPALTKSIQRLNRNWAFASLSGNRGACGPPFMQKACEDMRKPPRWGWLRR